MNIVLITSTNTLNYGATLQSAALSKVLSAWGEVTVLDYAFWVTRNERRLLRKDLSKKAIAMIAKDVFRMKARAQVIRRFQEFEKKQMNLSPRLDHNSIARYLDNLTCDFGVVGSDQLWNPEIFGRNGEFDEACFLTRAKCGKKFSYASSYGGHSFSSDQLTGLRNLAADFDSVSAREDDGAKLIGGLLGKEVPAVLDPTLLLTGDDWRDLVGISKNVEELKLPDRYLLLYSVPKLPETLQLARKVAEQHGLEIVAIDQNPFFRPRDITVVRNAGPEEFLTIFDGASRVATDSFHGCCFSITFDKPFNAVTKGAHANRLMSLRNRLGLGDMIRISGDSGEPESAELAGTETPEKLKQLREDSLAYIQKNLVF